MRNRTIIFLFLFISFISANAQSRKYSNEFLTLGVGSRAFGMSNAVVASVSDIYAGYWNPAALTSMQGKNQVALMHAEYFGAIANYDYAAVAGKIDDRSVGAISFIRFGVDDILNTTELIDAGGNINYDRISTFSAADYAFIGSYARKMPNENLSLGGNVKIVHRRIGDFAKAWGFGIDASALYQLKKFRFGLMARDITTTFNAWSYSLSDRTKEVFEETGNEIPENSIELTNPKIILASAFHSPISKKINLTAEIDLDITTDGERNVLLKASGSPISAEPHVGLEFDYQKIVYLRAGLGNIQKQINFDQQSSYRMQPNIGLGLKIKMVSIDYALTDIGNASDALYSNIFSVRFDIF